MVSSYHLKNNARWKATHPHPFFSGGERNLLYSTSSKILTQMIFPKKSRSFKKVIRKNIRMKNTSLFRTIVSEIMLKIVSCGHQNQSLFPGSNTY